MAMLGIAKSMVIAGLSLILLAGPMAFQQGCRMADCCCQPEATGEISLERPSCCECGISEMAQMPVQPAVAQAISVPDHVRTEMPIAFFSEIEISGNKNFSDRFIESHSLSPPFVNSSINTPLIC